jgi:OmpA-OmpF porin, OOP family
MAINLFDLLQNEFSSDVVTKIASFVGEAPAKTQTALTNAVPAVMCALDQKVSKAGGAAELFETFRLGAFDGKRIGSPAAVAGSASGLADVLKLGGPLVASLFGSRHSGLVDWLADLAGIGKSASSSLLGLVAPFVLNLIGRQAGSAGGFNAASVAELIKGQGSLLGSNAPRGLAQALGVSQCGGTPARAYAAGTPTASGGTELEGGWLKWLLPVLAMLLLGIGTVWWYARGAGTPPTTAALPTTAPPAATTPAPGPVGATLVKQTICSGQAIEVGANGVESMLIKFLDDKTSVIGADTRFSFDRIEFETDSAALKPSSRAQLKNIAEIMKCYPTLEIKIAGHTDSKADDAYNLKLSQERADSAKTELVALGVAPSRLAAEGFGEQFPIASNDTEEGRQRNRRTDVVITKK